MHDERGGSGMRICVVTSLPAAAEPRAPRHAVAAKRAFPDAEVIFIDLIAHGQERPPDPQILRSEGIRRLSVEFPTRAASIFSLATRKAITRLGRIGFAATGYISEGLFGDRAQGLTRALMSTPATLYIAHNVETLLPAARAARRHGARLIFDCMEYYSDMGDSQSTLEGSAARRLEARLLPACALVIASSDDLADVLATEYCIRRPLAAYNVPATEITLPERRGGGLNLYWRNSTLGFGQRGLEDMLQAMVRLPADVRLFLQGRLPPDGGFSLSERLNELGLRERVIVLPPYVPEDAVRQAAIHDVGLCLELRGPKNHELTVSNKMFDYHMGALAVVSSDLPSLARVIGRSKGGLLFRTGDPVSLAETIWQLKSSPSLLSELQANARHFAMEEANLDREIGNIVSALRAAILPTVLNSTIAS